MVGEPVVFITNSLQLAVPPDNPGEVGALADLASLDLSVVVCAEQVPCGNATASLFEQQGLTPNVVSFEPDVRATLSKVALGEADVGVVYRTDVTAAGDRVQGIEIPEDQNVINSYPVVAVSDADLGHRFIDFVLSEGGQGPLRDAGFVAP
jgi:molybdate transport system substrate-binding protein